MSSYKGSPEGMLSSCYANNSEDFFENSENSDSTNSQSKPVKYTRSITNGYALSLSSSTSLSSVESITHSLSSKDFVSDTTLNVLVPQIQPSSSSRPTTPLIDCESRLRLKIVEAFGNHLTRITYRNDKTAKTHPVTPFHSQKIPSTDISHYLERLVSQSPCSNDAAVASIMLMEKLSLTQGIPISSWNAHRLLLTSIMTCAKFLDDRYFNNAFYAKIGGIPLKEMNSLEIELLFLSNFSLHVYREKVDEYLNNVLHAYYY